MRLTLTEDLFTNNEYEIAYGGREARFTIVDEEFPGNNMLGRINRIVLLIRDASGDMRLCTTIIGMGDGYAGVYSSNPMLKGKLLTKDNMAECQIELVEVD